MAMSHRRGMSGSPDGETTEGLLTGTLAHQEAPTEWRPVAELLTVLRTLPATAPGFQTEASGGDESDDRHRQTVRAMAAILAEAPAHEAWRRHLRAPFRPSVPRPLNVYRVRLVTALVAATLAFMLGLASAGALPGPAQNAISVALSKFGITVPRGDDPGGPKTTPVGPDLSGPAKKGLCNAFFSGQGNKEEGKVDSGSVAFQNLQEAAKEAGKSVEDFCADVISEPTTSTGSQGLGKGHDKDKDKGKSKGHDPKSNEREPRGKGLGADHSPNGNANGHSKGIGPD